MSDAVLPSPPAAAPAGPSLRLGRLRHLWLGAPGGYSPQAVAAWMAAWFTLAGNLALWRALRELHTGLHGLLAAPCLVGGLTLAALSLLAWSRGARPLWMGLAVLAAFAQYAMLAYGIVLDPDMLRSALQTDAREMRDLAGWPVLPGVLPAALPALWVLARVRVRQRRWAGNAWRNLALCAAALAMAGLAVFIGYRDLAPLMRENGKLRYMANPVAAAYSAVRVVRHGGGRMDGGAPLPLGPATLGASYAGQKRPPLFLLVVGETSRADHYALNGYGRDTTPELAQRGVLSWRDVHFCGTHTLASVPCMFSGLGKAAFESRDREHENLLDLLQSAGLAVLWIDNQAGCKGVCDRVPNVSTRDTARAVPGARALCDGECLDEILLAGLDERIAALPAERRARGVVVVLHEMGSHGPSYTRRSPASRKRFLPECTTVALAQCDPAQLMNAYDNSIAYNDHVLAGAIDWLRGREHDYDGALLYLSDHGESLGEYGLYLHGIPYRLAPQVQKHVPMIAWLSRGFAARTGLAVRCLRGTLDEPLTHDNLFHSVLGLLDVQAGAYRGELDATAGCRAMGARAA
ncbi:phosphoethanolamine transferase [Xylophilus sp.]|uniref:phosphoethanolamine transferase n=1 Tax=Xylophilus sp. TaxID=2653893 RepID=UPI0013B8188F|nr:sulfatase-like hydrolase/transferase [Xylophilus sp.]KAF1047799.1 MAG: Phosphoethanolamine transferase EptA [Xylophilus sp.]